MKYLAILKDCLLEALDSKVLYVMMVLSVAVIILIGSVSYPLASVEEDASRAFEYNSSMHGENNVNVQWKFDHIEDFHATKDGAAVSKDQMTEPWLYDYSFLVVWAGTVTTSGEASPEAKLEVVKHAQAELVNMTDWPLKAHGSCQELENVSLKDEELKYDNGSVIMAPVRVTSHGTKVSRRVDWPHKLIVLFAVKVSSLIQVPLIAYVQFIEDGLVCTFGAAIALLLSTVMTAFFIPNMLRKGTIDFLIVKPISRTTLFIYKYIGGLSYMFINTVIIVVGVWLVVGLRTGMWGTGFLLSIPILTFEFAIFYAVSALFGVLTRSVVVCILMGCAAWAVMWVVGTGYNFIDATRHLREAAVAQKSRHQQPMNQEEDDSRYQKPFPEAVYTVADIMHFVVPRMKDLDVLIARAIQKDNLDPNSPERKATDKLYESFNGWEAFGVSAFWIAAMLALASWRFSTKDY